MPVEFSGKSLFELSLKIVANCNKGSDGRDLPLRSIGWHLPQLVSSWASVWSRSSCRDGTTFWIHTSTCKTLVFYFSSLLTNSSSAASAFAANTMLRSLVGACFPLFAKQMFENLGVQWAGTLIGCIATLMIPIPIAFRLYGPKLRQKSRLSPTRV